jgi:hypothetical protein
LGSRQHLVAHARAKQGSRGEQRANASSAVHVIDWERDGARERFHPFGLAEARVPSVVQG